MDRGTTNEAHWDGDTHWLVFHGGAGDTPVEFVVILQAGVDQLLYRDLLLEQQETIS